MEKKIHAVGAVPAICLVQRRRLVVGATLDQLAEVDQAPNKRKAGVRDLGEVIAQALPAGLTVSATLFAAHAVGIQVFATGGIGGVHHGAEVSGDVSSDLYQLARTPVVTVCAGAKSVLDLPRTLEYLETLGVPVVTYRSSYFPAFYLTSSGIETAGVESADEVAEIARVQWALRNAAGLVVGNPLPAAGAIPAKLWEEWADRAYASAGRDGIHGTAVTPYLLDKVATYSQGETVRANLALLFGNARLAAEIAVSLGS